MKKRIVGMGLLICGVVVSCGPEYPYFPPGTVPIVQRGVRGSVTAPALRACLPRRLSTTPTSDGNSIASCVVYGANMANGDCDAARGFSIDSMTGRCVVQQIAVRQFNDGGTAPTSMEPGWYASFWPTMTCQAELVFVGAAAPRTGESFEYECVAVPN